MSLNFRNIQLVIFALDRTLFDSDKAQNNACCQVDYWLKQYQIDNGCFWLRFEQVQSRTFDLCLEYKLSLAQFRVQRFTETLAYFGHHDQALAVHLNHVFMQSLSQARDFCHGALDILKYMFNCSKNMVILSNGLAEIQHEKIKNLKLDQMMQRFYLAEETGLYKPNISAFKQILHDYQLSPQQCLMIGEDEVLDIDPADRLGMWSYHVTNTALQQQPKTYRLSGNLMALLEYCGQQQCCLSCA